MKEEKLPEKPKFCCEQFKQEIKSRPYKKYAYIQDGNGDILYYLEQDRLGNWKQSNECPFCKRAV